MPNEVHHQESAKIICSYLDQLFVGSSSYRELIIIAEPKMLGFIRKCLSKDLKSKVTKEINKDLVKEGIKAVEAAVFS